MDVSNPAYFRRVQRTLVTCGVEQDCGQTRMILKATGGRVPTGPDAMHWRGMLQGCCALHLGWRLIRNRFKRPQRERCVEAARSDAEWRVRHSVAEFMTIAPHSLARLERQ